MSDQSQGEGWWQATDDKWYPPKSTLSAPVSPAPGAVGAPGPDIEGSFVERLFDTTFRQFVTPSIIKVLFWIGVALVSLYAVFFFIAFAAQGGGLLVAGLIGAPVMWILSVLYMRVLLEVIVVLFRIEENTRN